MSICLLPVLTSNSQTCVIAKKVNDTICVGADNPIVRTVTDRTTKQVMYQRGSMCKIYTDGKLNFAVIGKMTIESMEVLMAVSKVSKTWGQVVKNYRDSFSRRMEAMFTDSKQQRSNYFNDLLKLSNERKFNTVIFFGKDADSLTLFSLTFYLDLNRAKGSYKIYGQIIYSDIFCEGHTDEIAQVSKLKTTWQQALQKQLST